MRWRQIAVGPLVATSVAGLAHLAVSAAAAYVMASYHDRVFDVRTFESPEYPALVGGWMDASAITGRTVVAGSSFSFGYPYSADRAFPSTAGALNASILGAGLGLIAVSAVCEMKARALRPKQLVVEVPLVNETYGLVHYSRNPVACPQAEHGSLFRFTLANLVGLKWYNLLKDQYDGTRQSDQQQIGPLNRDYFVTRDQFAKIKPDFRERLREMYKLSTEVADDVYLLVTPVFIPGISRAGDKDPERVREQFAYAEAVCSELAGERCIDTSWMIDTPDYYVNLTHLNGLGAAALGAFVKRALGKPAG